MNIVDQQKPDFEKCINHLKHEITGLRTGRATPALVEDIVVEAYGTKQSIKAVASISVLDAKTLSIEPWDKSVLQNIEISLRNSNLGINPVNDGKALRLPLPDLTQDRRQELIKVLNHKLEQARISVRQVREDIKKNIDNALKDKIIAEDEKFTLQENLEKLVKDYNEEIKDIGLEKEKEINTI